MNKGEMIDAVAASTGQSKAVVKSILEACTEEKASALRRGEDVALAGWGSYKVQQRDQREARNPRTGERITIAPRKVVKFSAASSLADGVNRR
jgi:DNA-binding protein HU-beta